MISFIVRHVLIAVVLLLAYSTESFGRPKPPPNTDKTQEQEYKEFVKYFNALDYDGAQKDNAGAIRKIQSSKTSERREGFRKFWSATADDLGAIAWFIPWLADSEMACEAATAMSKVVTEFELKRQKGGVDKVALCGTANARNDLAPLKWLLRKMLESGDRCAGGSAATMIGYIGLTSLTADLRAFGERVPDPAYKRSAEYALEQLEKRQKDIAHFCVSKPTDAARQPEEHTPLLRIESKSGYTSAENWQSRVCTIFADGVEIEIEFPHRKPPPPAERMKRELPATQAFPSALAVKEAIQKARAGALQNEGPGVCDAGTSEITALVAPEFVLYANKNCQPATVNSSPEAKKLVEYVETACRGRAK